MSPFVHTFTLWITCGQLWISTASLVPENRKLVCDIYGFTTIIITNQHKTYRHPPNTHHTHTSYSPPANCLLTRQPATQATNQATKTASQASQPTRARSIASQQASKPASGHWPSCVFWRWYQRNSIPQTASINSAATGSPGIKPTRPASAIDIQNIRPKVTTNCPKLVFLQFKLPLALLNKCVYAVSN